MKKKCILNLMVRVSYYIIIFLVASFIIGLFVFTNISYAQSGMSVDIIMYPQKVTINDSSSATNAIFTAQVKGGSGSFKYYWDFGDGNTTEPPFFQNGTSDTIGHRYISDSFDKNTANYQINLKVIDSNGTTANASPVAVTVFDPDWKSLSVYFAPTYEAKKSGFSDIKQGATYEIKWGGTVKSILLVKVIKPSYEQKEVLRIVDFQQPIKNGVYKWKVPENIPVDFGYRFQVITEEGKTAGMPSSFYIVPPNYEFKVLSPNGGEKLTQGDTYKISWKGAVLSISGTGLKETLPSVGGGTFEVDESPFTIKNFNEPVLDGEYLWTIPVWDEFTGEKFKVSIGSLSGNRDRSDNFFSVVAQENDTDDVQKTNVITEKPIEISKDEVSETTTTVITNEKGANKETVTEKEEQQKNILTSKDITEKLEEKNILGEVRYDSLVSIEFVENESKYDIHVAKSGRFLFIFPIILEITITVDAEDGSVKNTKKPWWSFLVKE